MKNKNKIKYYGWHGRVLNVDLTDRTIKEKKLPENLINDYIGASGINARLLYDLMKDNIHADPLSSENPLIFGFGPSVGTTFPCASRFTVTAKSPLTGIFGDSNAGGYFSLKVKQAGYDHIVITGKADNPLALLIEEDGSAQLVDARDLWGLDTYETDDLIQDRFGSCESARIGPAGENLVRYANIFSGRKRVGANGRAGMGCVMGSKKLKAIIVKGSGTVPVYDKNKLDHLASLYGEIWGKGPGTAANAEYGTLILIAQIGTGAAVNNDQMKITDEQLEHYDIEEFLNTFKDGKTACYRCPVGCSQKWKVDSGPYSGAKGDKIEFGHYLHLGPLLGIFDFPSLFHLSDISNRTGLDCTQFGWNLSMAIECFQRSIIGLDTTDGIALNWGNVEMVSNMLIKVSKREGFGSILAENIPEMIRTFGTESEPFGYHTKSMTFPYNRKEVMAMGLATSVATRGADHMKGHPFSGLVGAREMLERIFGTDIPEEIADPRSTVAKGRVVWWHENYKMLMDSLGLCFIPLASTTIFGDPLILFEELGEIYHAITGKDPATLFESAERAYQTERCFNALLGIDKPHDMRQGKTRGEDDPITHTGMLDEYYLYRGCSPEGIPTRKRLEEIRLGDIADDLVQTGKLSDRQCPAIDELIVKK